MDQSLGEHIRQLREDQGLGRRELAKRAGVTYSYLSKIETGERVGSLSTLTKIAEALGMTVSAIQAGDTNMLVANIPDADLVKAVVHADGSIEPADAAAAGERAMVLNNHPSAYLRERDTLLLAPPPATTAMRDGDLVVAQVAGAGPVVRYLEQAGSIWLLRPLDPSGPTVVLDGSGVFLRCGIRAVLRYI